MNITRKSKFAIRVIVIRAVNVSPTIFPVVFCPDLKGIKKHKNVSPYKTKQNIIVNAFIQFLCCLVGQFGRP